MTEISAKDVMNLREKTGVSMMACKKALTEASGDEEKAIEILRKSGEAKAASKSTRSTSEGIVAVLGKSIIKVNCETDFVAKNNDFKMFVSELVKIADEKNIEEAEKYFDSKKAEMISKIGENLTFNEGRKIKQGNTVGHFLHFNNKIAAVVALSGGSEEVAKEIAMHVVAVNPDVLSPNEVDEKLLEKERDIWNAELEKSGKPENIRTMIMEGKEKKFREENALLTQPFVKNDKITVGEYAKQNGAEIVDFIRLAV